MPFALFAVQEIKTECPLEFNRERRENREQKRSVPCRSEAVPGGKERKENGVSPVVFGQAKKGVSIVILTAKVCMVRFSLFVSFALFAVHGIQRECPLYFESDLDHPRQRGCPSE